MKLECENGNSFENPSPKTIEHVLANLGQPGTVFVILSKEEQVYIQAGADVHGKCDIEYRDGCESRHFCSTNDTVNVQQIIEAFQDYAADNDAWISRFSWEPLVSKSGKKDNTSPEQPVTKSGCLGMVLLVAGFWGVVLLLTGCEGSLAGEYSETLVKHPQVLNLRSDGTYARQQTGIPGTGQQGRWWKIRGQVVILLPGEKNQHQYFARLNERQNYSALKPTVVYSDDLHELIDLTEQAGSPKKLESY